MDNTDLDNLVRDLTQSHPLSKSKVREMIEAYVQQEIAKARIDELAKLREHNKTVPVHSSTDSYYPSKYIEVVETKRLDERSFELSQSLKDNKEK